ncbi:TPA: hypothetical protein ACP7Q5_005051 [Escherichia coli]|jgi:hypothetical protein|uniref:Uncharacterized protein n=7 Tax=root TaxID=1 RepID=A0A8S5UHS5_9CAUD|nr:MULTISPECIES: hypothetical protein [Enterococcus]ELG7156245.1 hypothetical protein [Staphylococcus aureus]DAF94049.1 MAG TPA: hypothetical protein [Myoviridae sp. ctu2j3]HDW3906885.1 hypothetical protein [Escherichia coli]MDN3040790.1 hypothetical protein [Enterococcus faecium]MDN3155437.1 hypothetical protein [Enterococcus faecalis]
MNECKPGGCSSLGCEGGHYCFNEDGTAKPMPEGITQDMLNRFGFGKGNKMNVQPYGRDELAAANAAGYLILDWAEGLTHLRAGFRKMDDALPGQNQKLASEGFQQATLGLSIIHDFFKARGIDLSV